MYDKIFPAGLNKKTFTADHFVLLQKKIINGCQNFRTFLTLNYDTATLSTTTQPSNAKHKDTQHYGLNCDIQHKRDALCVVMLRVIILSVMVPVQ